MVLSTILFIAGWVASLFHWLHLYEPYSTYVLYLCIAIGLYHALEWTIPRFTKGNMIYKTIILLIGGYMVISAFAVGPQQLLVWLYTPLYIWMAISILLLVTGAWSIHKLWRFL